MTDQHNDGRLSLARDADAPGRRLRRRNEALAIAGMDFVRQAKLPAWAVVVLLVAAMGFYTVRSSLTPLFGEQLDAAIDARLAARLDDAVDEALAVRIDAALDERLDAAIDARLAAAVEASVASEIGKQLDLALDDDGSVARVADQRIVAYHEHLGCGADLALLLRVLADPKSGLLDGNALPGDLRLCMLLDEKARAQGIRSP